MNKAVALRTIRERLRETSAGQFEQLVEVYSTMPDLSAAGFEQLLLAPALWMATTTPQNMDTPWKWRAFCDVLDVHAAVMSTFHTKKTEPEEEEEEEERAPENVAQ